MFEVRDAVIPEELDFVRTLFQEYANGLGVDLCFQNFTAELKELPGAYTRPQGRLLLAQRIDGDNTHSDIHSIAACVAMRPTADGSCEMKRLYVRPAFRGYGLGRTLALRVLDEAKTAGYPRVVLDTLPQMTSAILLYQSLGFTPIDPYYTNPVAGALFLGKRLNEPTWAQPQ